MGLQKTIAFIILILIGVLLKRKITSKEQVSGIKAIILSVALPATIFIALLKIEISTSLLMLPIIALAVNFLMFGGARIFSKLFSYEREPQKHRTLMLLIPSFAPGLSCFPFLTEYLGEQSLALGALADVGNKIFGLIILYLIAMTWHYNLLKSETVKKSGQRYKKLLISLVSEPINLVIIVGILMLALGLNFVSLPSFGRDAITKLSLIMTPLVLMFIGLAVKVGRKDIMNILQILCWRSGFAFLLSAVMIFLLPSELSPLTLLVAVVLPQSSCSFWPYAHMAAVSKLDEAENVKTFDLNLAVNVLAFSLPFSTTMILLICSSNTFFADPQVLVIAAAVLISMACIPLLYKVFSGRSVGVLNQGWLNEDLQ